MQLDPRYDDVVTEFMTSWPSESSGPRRSGIPRERIAVDPGIGFGKTAEHNLEILRNLDRFDTLGCVILVGTSRKGFLGSITGRPVSERSGGHRWPPRSAACLAGRPGRPGARRRRDGRRDSRLDGSCGVGRLAHEHGR